MTLGRDLCGNWDEAVRREWLVANGLGGYACGTVALANTRRYHAFLMASLAPPVERTLLVAKVEVSVDYLGRRYALTSNEFADGTVDPRGFADIESFAVEDGIPVWRYALADALLEQRIFMAPGANVSYLTLQLRRASAAARIELKPLAAYRGMHAHEQGGPPFGVEARAAGCTVRAFEGARPFHLEVDRGDFTAVNEWYWKFFHREEAARGLDALEDLFVPGVFRAEISPGMPLAFTASAEQSTPAEPVRVANALLERSRALRAALPAGAPAWIETLATASDQFLVRRGDAAGSFSIIAGFPWFADWGRDTMISLPGLATVFGTLRRRGRHLAHLRAIRGSRHDPEPLSGRGHCSRVQHRGCHALDVPGARRLSRGEARPGADARAVPGRQVHHQIPRARHALRDRRRSRGRPAARRRARHSAHLDGRQARRSGLHAAHRQARRNQRALAERPVHRPRVWRTASATPRRSGAARLCWYAPPRAFAASGTPSSTASTT